MYNYEKVNIERWSRNMLIFSSIVILFAGSHGIINSNVVSNSEFFYAVASIGLGLFLIVGLFGYFAGYYRSLAWSYVYLFGLLFCGIWLLFYTVSFETWVSCDYSISPDCYVIKPWPRALFYIITTINTVFLISFILCATNYISLLTHWNKKHGGILREGKLKVDITLENVDSTKLKDGN